MPKQAYTVPCRASHPRGQGAQVLCTSTIAGHCAALTHVSPVLDHKIVENTIRSDLSISPISLEIALIPIILLPNYTSKLSL